MATGGPYNLNPFPKPNLTLIAAVKQWFANLRRKRRRERSDLVQNEAENMLHRARYIFNVAQIDNGYLVFYEYEDTSVGYSNGDSRQHVRFCKDIKELPDIILGLNAQLRLNI